METRTVPLGVGLSVGTSILLCEDFGAVHELIEWLVGEPTWTHQLPRVGRECQAWLKRCDPRLGDLQTESITTENWRDWLAEVEAKWGATLTVQKMPVEEHRHIDPITEGTQVFGQPPIVIVTDSP